MLDKKEGKTTDSQQTTREKYVQFVPKGKRAKNVTKKHEELEKPYQTQPQWKKNNTISVAKRKSQLQHNISHAQNVGHAPDRNNYLRQSSIPDRHNQNPDGSNKINSKTAHATDSGNTTTDVHQNNTDFPYNYKQQFDSARKKFDTSEQEDHKLGIAPDNLKQQFDRARKKFDTSDTKKNFGKIKPKTHFNRPTTKQNIHENHTYNEAVIEEERFPTDKVKKTIRYFNNFTQKKIVNKQETAKQTSISASSTRMVGDHSSGPTMPSQPITKQDDTVSTDSLPPPPPSTTNYDSTSLYDQPLPLPPAECYSASPNEGPNDSVVSAFPALPSQEKPSLESNIVVEQHEPEQQVPAPLNSQENTDNPRSVTRELNNEGSNDPVVAVFPAPPSQEDPNLESDTAVENNEPDQQVPAPLNNQENTDNKRSVVRESNNEGSNDPVVAVFPAPPSQEDPNLESDTAVENNEPDQQVPAPLNNQENTDNKRSVVRESNNEGSNDPVVAVFPAPPSQEDPNLESDTAVENNEPDQQVPAPLNNQENTDNKRSVVRESNNEGSNDPVVAVFPAPPSQEDPNLESNIVVEQHEPEQQVPAPLTNQENTDNPRSVARELNNEGSNDPVVAVFPAPPSQEDSSLESDTVVAQPAELNCDHIRSALIEKYGVLKYSDTDEYLFDNNDDKSLELWNELRINTCRIYIHCLETHNGNIAATDIDKVINQNVSNLIRILGNLQRKKITSTDILLYDSHFYSFELLKNILSKSTEQLSNVFRDSPVKTCSEIMNIFSFSIENARKKVEQENKWHTPRDQLPGNKQDIQYDVNDSLKNLDANYKKFFQSGNKHLDIQNRFTSLNVNNLKKCLIGNIEITRNASEKITSKFHRCYFQLSSKYSAQIAKYQNSYTEFMTIQKKILRLMYESECDPRRVFDDMENLERAFVTLHESFKGMENIFSIIHNNRRGFIIHLLDIIDQNQDKTNSEEFKRFMNDLTAVEEYERDNLAKQKIILNEKAGLMKDIYLHIMKRLFNVQQEYERIMTNLPSANSSKKANFSLEIKSPKQEIYVPEQKLTTLKTEDKVSEKNIFNHQYKTENIPELSEDDSISTTTTEEEYILNTEKPNMQNNQKKSVTFKLEVDTAYLETEKNTTSDTEDIIDTGDTEDIINHGEIENNKNEKITPYIEEIMSSSSTSDNTYDFEESTCSDSTIDEQEINPYSDNNEIEETISKIKDSSDIDEIKRIVDKLLTKLEIYNEHNAKHHLITNALDQYTNILRQAGAQLKLLGNALKAEVIEKTDKIQEYGQHTGLLGNIIDSLSNVVYVLKLRLGSPGVHKYLQYFDTIDALCQEIQQNVLLFPVQKAQSVKDEVASFNPWAHSRKEITNFITKAQDYSKELSSVNNQYYDELSIKEPVMPSGNKQKIISDY